MRIPKKKVVWVEGRMMKRRDDVIIIDVAWNNKNGQGDISYEHCSRNT